MKNILRQFCSNILVTQQGAIQMISTERMRMIRRTSLVSTILIGLALHDLYKGSGLTMLALISPVNESKWEHWKMAYSSMMIVGGVEYLFLKRDVDIKPSNSLLAIAGGILVFEGATFGAIELFEILHGKSELWFHVSSFLAGAYLGHKAKYLILKKTKPSLIVGILGGLILTVQLAAFVRFTFDPPKQLYFRDSLTETYGIYLLK